MVDRIHVIDPDFRRRAQVSRELSTWNIHAEIYEDLEEFCQVNPHDGFLFAAENSPGPANTIEALRANGVQLPVVMYAEQPSTENVVSAMRSGAFDYLQWPFDPSGLRSTFRRLNHDGSRMRQEARLRAASMAKIGRLTNREREVLVRLVQGMSNKEMASDLRISPRTVEIHRGNTMTKLNAQSAADAVRIALYAGLDEGFRFAA
jgi:two-component system, LuxR family, response regulator FixJ